MERDLAVVRVVAVVMLVVTALAAMLLMARFDPQPMRPPHPAWKVHGVPRS